MKTASIRTALIAAAIVAIGAFALLSIGGADAQQACVQTLAGNGAYSGTWDSTCLSENTPQGGDYYPTGTRYARFYTFTLSAPSTVTVELNSTTDPYLYVMQGKGKTGTILHYNDDVIPNQDTNSRISESLSAGDYTIEATTYDVEVTGSFTLTVSGLPTASTPTLTPTAGTGDNPTVTPTPTFTPSPTPTSTSGASTPVPSDVLNRLTALETRVATQQGVISTLDSKITALDSRVATLEAGAPNPTPSSNPCRIARPYGYQPSPENLHDFWDKRDNCLLEIQYALRVTDEARVEGFDGEHYHYGVVSYINDGQHSHYASVRVPYNHALYKYDPFVATNPNRTPWQAKLEVPTTGLYPSLWVNEYNPQTDEWNTVDSCFGAGSFLGSLFRTCSIEWTPVTGKTYSVVAILRRGFMESPFTLTYDLASESDSQGAQSQIVPTDLAPPQLQSLQRAIEDMRVEDADELGAE